MKYLGLIVLTVSLVTGCDPGDESLGDTGAEGGESSTGASNGSLGDTGGSSVTAGETEDSNSTVAETESAGDDSADPCAGQDGGCADSFTLMFGAELIPPGSYSIQLRRGGDDEVLESCEFTLPGGGGNCGYWVEEEQATVSLSPEDANIQEAMRLVISHSGVVIHDELREFDYEIRNFACSTCTSVNVEVDLAGAQCTALETAFDAAVQEVRGCSEASECGTVIPGYSCGCTRDWVGRLDADPAVLTDAAMAGTAGECGWAAWGSDCDCPEADGFDCVDEICTWNYVAG